MPKPPSDYGTPKDFYMALDAEFRFDDDPCRLGEGQKLFLDHNGLTREWGQSTFVNPPYSNPRPWIEKAILEASRGKTVVMLLKSDTSTGWFHDLVLPRAEEIRWIRGRLHFRGGRWRAPFPVFIAIFRKRGCPCPSTGIGNTPKD